MDFDIEQGHSRKREKHLKVRFDSHLIQAASAATTQIANAVPSVPLFPLVGPHLSCKAPRDVRRHTQRSQVYVVLGNGFEFVRSGASQWLARFNTSGCASTNESRTYEVSGRPSLTNVKRGSRESVERPIGLARRSLVPAEQVSALTRF